MLRGPADAQVDQLRSDGWDPDGARRIPSEGAAAEQAQVENLDNDPRWRRGRLRDIVAKASESIWLNDALRAASPRAQKTPRLIRENSRSKQGGRSGSVHR